MEPGAIRFLPRRGWAEGKAAALERLVNIVCCSNNSKRDGEGLFQGIGGQVFCLGLKFCLHVVFFSSICRVLERSLGYLGSFFWVFLHGSR